MLFFGMESAAALSVSLFINICVVAVFARGFYGKGIPDIGLENAGRYLGDTFGTSMVLNTALSGSPLQRPGLLVCQWFCVCYSGHEYSRLAQHWPEV